MSTFSSNQLVHVPLYFMEKKLKSGFVKHVVLDEKKVEEMLKDEKTKDEVKCFDSWWKILSWSEQQNITKQATFTNAEGQQDFDFFKFRDLRVKTCLKKWSRVDESGKEVPVSPESIGDMPSDIIFAMLNKFDSITSLSEDEEKN